MTVLGGKLNLSPAMSHEYKNAMARIRRSHPHLSLQKRKSMAMKEIGHQGGYTMLGAAHKRKHMAKKPVGRPRKHVAGYTLGGARKRKHMAKKPVGRPRKHVAGYTLGGAILGGYPFAAGARKKTAVRGKRAADKKVKDLIKMLGL